MTMFAAALTGEGIRGHLNWKSISSWGQCFGGFQENLHDLDDPGKTLCHVLIKAGHLPNDFVASEAMRQFLLSEPVRKLTEGNIVGVEIPKDDWFGDSIHRKVCAPNNLSLNTLLHVVFKADAHADGIVTAFRVAQQLFKQADYTQYAHIPEDQLWIAPLVAALRASSGYSYSDSYPIFVPITAGQAREYQADNEVGDWSDVYYDDFANWAGGFSVTHGTIQDAANILTLPPKTPRKGVNLKIYMGYDKDEELNDLGVLSDDESMSITHGWTHDLGTGTGDASRPISRGTLQDAVAAVKALL